MNWDDARIFLAVARAGQILGAARRLDLNHATVSRRIAALETALDAKLFRRHTTGSELTPAGERFLGVAERMEADMIAARAEIAGEGEAVAGTVRIGAPDGFGVAYLAPRLGALTARASATCRSSSCRCRAPSRCRGARPTSPSPSSARPKAGWSRQSWSTIRSASMRRAPMPRRTACRKRRPSCPATCWSATCPISSPAPRSTMRPSSARTGTPRFSISSALGQVEAVRSGAGIGILHTFIARSIPELVPVTAVPPIRRAYWLVYHEIVQADAPRPDRGRFHRQTRRERAVLVHMTAAAAAMPASVLRGTRSACRGLHPTARVSRRPGSP